MVEAFSIAEGEMSIEDVVVGRYNFRIMVSIQRAFDEWPDLDFQATLRRGWRIGLRVMALDAESERIIKARHGVIHRPHIDRSLQKHETSKLLDTAMAVVNAFVDHPELDGSVCDRDHARAIVS